MDFKTSKNGEESKYIVPGAVVSWIIPTIGFMFELFVDLSREGGREN